RQLDGELSHARSTESIDPGTQANAIRVWLLAYGAVHGSRTGIEDSAEWIVRAIEIRGIENVVEGNAGAQFQMFTELVTPTQAQIESLQPPGDCLIRRRWSNERHDGANLLQFTQVKQARVKQHLACWSRLAGETGVVGTNN